MKRIRSSHPSSAVPGGSAQHSLPATKLVSPCRDYNRRAYSYRTFGRSGNDVVGLTISRLYQVMCMATERTTWIERSNKPFWQALLDICQAQTRNATRMGVLPTQVRRRARQSQQDTPIQPWRAFCQAVCRRQPGSSLSPHFGASPVASLRGQRSFMARSDTLSVTHRVPCQLGARLGCSSSTTSGGQCAA